jgi:flavin reductase (DIM6/NTAB) family NADH-FMN oxidoreductase RutF
MKTAFDEIVATLDAPMIIVTVAAGDERDGCLVGFSTQCSIHPARYAVFISKLNRTSEIAARADTLVVHFLRPENMPLAELFGEETGDEVQKFDRCSWRPGPAGVPVLDGCDWIAGTVRDRIDTGDHILHLLDVSSEGQVTTPRTGQLGFQAVRGMKAGHPA